MSLGVDHLRYQFCSLECAIETLGNNSFTLCRFVFAHRPLVGRSKGLRKERKVWTHLN